MSAVSLKRPASAPLPAEHGRPVTPRSIQRVLEALGLPNPSFLFTPIASKSQQAPWDLDDDTNPLYSRYANFVRDAAKDLDLPAFRQIPFGCLAEETRKKIAFLFINSNMFQNTHASISSQQKCLELMEKTINKQRIPQEIPHSPREEDCKRSDNIDRTEDLIGRLCAQQTITNNKRDKQFIKDLSGNIFTPLMRDQLMTKGWHRNIIDALSQKSEAEFQSNLAQAALDQYDISVFEHLPHQTIAPLLLEISRRIEIFWSMENWLLGNT